MVFIEVEDWQKPFRREQSSGFVFERAEIFRVKKSFPVIVFS
jgi:hypothetical protein